MKQPCLNKKVIIKNTKKYGKGLFAGSNIKKNEVIADWTGGRIYNCRKIIRGYRFLPQNIREKYGSYISEWLRN